MRAREEARVEGRPGPQRAYNTPGTQMECTWMRPSLIKEKANRAATSGCSKALERMEGGVCVSLRARLCGKGLEKENPRLTEAQRATSRPCR